MKKYLMIAAVALLAVAFVSCCPCRKGKAKTTVQLTEANWQLVQMDGKAVEASQDSYTVMFSKDNRINGRGDCNRFMGSYEIKNGKLEISKIASTMAMCRDQATEDRFLKIIGESDGYTIDGNMLMLLTGGEVKLAFKAYTGEAR